MRADSRPLEAPSGPMTGSVIQRSIDVAKVTYYLRRIPTVAWGIILTIVFLLLSAGGLQSESMTLLSVSFLIIGMTHGALDHLTEAPVKNNRMLIRFISKYVLKAIAFGVLWKLLPMIALGLFLIYSAWHFGQADFKEWGLREDWKAFAWGFGIIALILVLHPTETALVLGQMPGINITFNEAVSAVPLLRLLTLATITGGIAMAIYLRSMKMAMTLSYILLSGFLPLLISFGTYFVAQHSLNSWKQLKQGLGEDYGRLWIKSLPFSISGFIVILIFMAVKGTDQLGTLFIVLSCLSIPHVIRMHHFYRKANRA